MTKPKAPKKKRANAGTSRAEAAERRKRFVEAYLTNGGNATRAAVSAGFSPASAGARGSELVKDREISQLIAARQTQVLGEMEISTDRVLTETARLAFSDVSKIIGPTGKVLLPNELDPATRAAVKSFEIDEYGRVKYQFWDKNSASERLFKYLDLYKDDNKGKAPLTQVAIIRLVDLAPLPGKNGITIDQNG